MSSKNNIKLTFLGTGTSQGVPVIACDCEVCLSKDSKDTRFRSSVLIEIQGKKIVVDTGPDFRLQMLNNNVQQLDAVLFTHKHKDHTAGLDDVRAFNFKQKKDMEVYLNKDVEETLKREYEYIFSGNNYPGIPRVNLNLIPERSEYVEVEGIKVQLINMLHFKLPVYGFRFGNIAYCTDVNYIDPSEKEKLRGLDVLIVTALRKEAHVSHFNLAQALALIEEINPKKAYLTHISHLLGTHAEVSKELPNNVEIAYDGLQISSPIKA